MWSTEIELRLVNEALRAYVDESTLAAPGRLTLTFESEEVGRAILAAELPPSDDVLN